MELTSWTLYWITLLGNIEVAINALNTIAIGFIGAMFVIFALTEGESNLFKKYGKPLVIVFCSTLLLTCFFPNKKELIAIYFIPKIANSSLAQKIPEGIEKSIDAYLQDQFNLFKEDKKE